MRLAGLSLRSRFGAEDREAEDCVHRVAFPVVLVIAVLAVVAAARADPRAVVELFTSQGCSSCPPADRLIGELARDPAIVALSLPIDYWDYLGWKDTLADPRHTARQRGYARVRGDREVYTPQVVINGAAHALGSDGAAIDAAIRATRADASTLSVPVKLSLAAGRLEVNVAPAADTPPAGEVWLCGLAKAVPVAIGRGENGGRTVVYHNVVRRWLQLGAWNGSEHSFSVPTTEFAENGVDALAVIVQAGSLGRPSKMLGAAIQSLR
jgi:hypothetical protein